MDVPKSGCLAIRMVGTNTITKDITKVWKVMGSERLPMYRATIKGTASFSSSEG